MNFENGYHQLYNDINADEMFDYIKNWMGKDSKKNQVKWNSAKVAAINSDFLRPKNYVKKLILMAIGLLIAMIALMKRFKKCFRACTAV